MTQLNTYLPESTFGDLITVLTDYLSPSSQPGFTSVLKNIQDGFGHDSILQISLTEFNINRSGGNFLLDGVALTASSDQLNTISSSFIQDSLFNLFLGSGAGNLTVTGTENVAFGLSSQHDIASGTSNSSFGNNSLEKIQSGDGNCAFGEGSLFDSILNDNNSAFGLQSLLNFVIGGNNTSIGALSGSANTSYDSCTFLGYNADCGVNGLTNATAIGANANINVSNAINLGSGCFVGINNFSPEYPLDIETIGGLCAIQMKNSTLPATPAVGSGVIYISGGNLFYLNSAGVSVQLN